MTLDLKQLGWCPYFEQAFQPFSQDGFDVARVAVEHRDCYSLWTRHGEVTAEVAGKMLHAMESNADLPKVGDWVVVEFFEDNRKAVIHDFLPRKTKFSRKVAGKQFNEQVLATNIDVIFIVQSLDGNFSVRRLERTLVLVFESGARPVILLNKTDLCSQVRRQVKQAAEVADGVEILAVSARKGSGLRKLRKLIKAGETYAFIGSSGVGKSTLINKIIGQEIQKTQEVRAFDAKGRHTTSRRELILVPGGGCVIDTPGMRELQLWHADEGLTGTFADIEELVAQCYFSDCSHTKEIRCAVLAAVEQGTLERQRYESYMKMQKELSFLESKKSQSGYAEQRRKQRAQGKMYKKIQEGKRKRRRL
ncbi:MAG: ribosome small subunit-dependent GTPase A [bacterium]